MSEPSKSQQTPDEDLQVDAMVEELAAKERARTRRTALISLFGLVVIVGLVAWMVQNAEALFRPDVDYQGGELTMVEESTDPVCREMEREIETLNDDFEDYEIRFEEGILSDDEAEVEHLRETARAFRSRFGQVEARADEAVFNSSRAEQSGHPPVQEQLTEWFGHMDNEFRILSEMADRQVRRLRGEDVEERPHLWQDPPALRDQVLMTIVDNFQEFRVWSTQGAHFCGPAPEGVEPWKPDAPPR